MNENKPKLLNGFLFLSAISLILLVILLYNNEIREEISLRSYINILFFIL